MRHVRTFTGTRRDDYFRGTDQADLIAGLRGNDDLSGGAGDDRINLRSIDADTAARGNQPFHCIGDAAFSGTAGEWRATVSDGVTIVEGDVNGDGVADGVLVVHGDLPLIATDFAL